MGREATIKVPREPGGPEEPKAKVTTWRLAARLFRSPAQRKADREAARAEARRKLHEAMQLTRPPSPYDERRRRALMLPDPGGLPSATRVRDSASERILSPFPMPSIVDRPSRPPEGYSLRPTIGPSGMAVACPDGPACSHAGCERVGCFRVACEMPVTGVYPGDEWPRIS